MIEIPFGLTVSVAVYILFQIFGNIYMYMINGTGKVRIQLIVYIVFAIISYPIMTFMCENGGNGDIGTSNFSLYNSGSSRMYAIK